MIQRIMIPTDGSPESEQAVPIAEHIAAAQGAEALFVQVLEYPVLIGGYAGITADIYQQYLNAVAEEANTNLSRLSGQFADRGIRASTMRLRGNPAACLLDTEREQNVDLVVMSTRGRSGLARFALGSVAERLVREGTKPVLIARATSLEPSLATVLLMLDGSGVAEEAVPIIEALAGRPIEKVKLFRAVGDPDDRGAAATYLQGVSLRLSASGLETEIAADVGDATMLVRRAAQGVGLVVLCTHGLGGFDRFRHGSVADRVVREVEQPVLLVRAGMPATADNNVRTGSAAAAPQA